MTSTARTKSWRDWYRLARTSLGLGHGEGVEYANRRFVEEENRKRLRSRRSPRRPG
jgi:hypothetical protein